MNRTPITSCKTLRVVRDAADAICDQGGLHMAVFYAQAVLFPCSMQGTIQLALASTTGIRNSHQRNNVTLENDDGCSATSRRTGQCTHAYTEDSLEKLFTLLVTSPSCCMFLNVSDFQAPYAHRHPIALCSSKWGVAGPKSTRKI